MKATEVDGAELPVLKLVDREQFDLCETGLIDYGAGPDTLPGAEPLEGRYIKWRRESTRTGTEYHGYEDGLIGGDGPILFTVQKCPTTKRWSLLVGKEIPGTWGWPHSHTYTDTTAGGCKRMAERYWRPNPVDPHEQCDDVADDQQEHGTREMAEAVNSRTNRYNGATVPLSAEAAEKYDTIIRLSQVFEQHPPCSDNPFDSAVLRLCERLKCEFFGKWPNEYMRLID